jgi:hypothetical protein
MHVSSGYSYQSNRWIIIPLVAVFVAGCAGAGEGAVKGAAGGALAGAASGVCYRRWSGAVMLVSIWCEVHKLARLSVQ